MPQYVALAIAVLIGVLLGALGSGASIVTLPVLVYIAGIRPQSAVPMSMVIVGAASLLTSYLHARRGHFHAKAAALVSVTGVAGAYLGSAGTHFVSSTNLMLIFSTVLLVVGALMFWGGVDKLPRQVCRPYYCLAAGAFVGLLTGFLGVGGGFLIVPALTFFAGLDMKSAVGTSLAIIALNSVAGLLGHLRFAELDWKLTSVFTALTVSGMLVGLTIGERISQDVLRKAFASLLVLVAVVVGTLNLFVL